MIKTTILISLLFGHFILLGQIQTFTYEFITENDDRLWSVFEAENGNVFCVGHIAKPYSNKYNGLIIKLNQKGELIKQRIINIPGRSYDIYHVLQDSLQSIIICGKSSDTTPSMSYCKLELKRMNYDLKIIDSSSSIITTDKSINGLAMQFGKNSDLLFTGSVMFDTPPHLYDIKLRTNNSLDSIRFYQKTEGVGTIGQQINQINDTLYWGIGWFGAIYSFFSIDTSFNTISIHKVPKEVNQVYGIKWDTDTSFFMSGAWKTIDNDDDIGIIRQFHPFDTTNYIFNSWGKKGIYDYPAPNGSLDFKNIDSVFIGAITSFQPIPYSNSKYVLIQVDSLLNIRWERFYGIEGYYLELMKVLATKDGGCILAGTKYNYNLNNNTRDIYILKVNAEGLITGTNGQMAPVVHEAIVYPNPGRDYLRVRVGVQHKQSVFKLFDMAGHLVLTKTIEGRTAEINTQFLQPGTYIYTITNNSGLNENGKWVKE